MVIGDKGFSGKGFATFMTNDLQAPSSDQTAKTKPHGLVTWVASANGSNPSLTHSEGQLGLEHLGARIIAVGSSPGGAAPKAWIINDRGHMWLAKFPRMSDAGDVSAWEHLAMLLQRQAGIRVQGSQILRHDPQKFIFLTRCIPYQSFKTMFRFDDMERRDYATLAREVARISSAPQADAQELFARAAFGVMVNNIDDHMKKHGLLREGGGSRLAPSFDVNPSRRGFSETPLTPEDEPVNPDLRVLVAHAGDFHFTRHQAAKRLGQIAPAVESWTDQARALGIESGEIGTTGVAFDEVYRRLAYELADS